MKVIGVNLTKLSLAVAVVASGSSAWAQAQPNIGDILQQTQPPGTLDREPTPPPRIGGTEEVPAEPAGPPLKALPAGPQVQVQRFEFIGNREIPTERLTALIGDAAGKSLTLAELEALALRVTKHYRARGYFVARAYIPQQEVSEGTIKIRVIEGSYGKFVLDNTSRVRDDVLQGILDDVKRQETVSVDTLERAISTINDTPGAKVTKADIVPGEAVGTSDFVVKAEATPPYRGYVLLDNHGSVYTGRHRASFNADLLSPTGRGDRLSIGGLVSNNTDLINGRVAYSALLAPTGLRGELAIGRVQYELGDIYKALDAKGSATGAEASLTHLLRRAGGQTVEGAVTGAYRRLDDRAGGADGTRSEKSLSSLTAGLSVRDDHALFGLNGLTQASAALTVGKLSINDALDLARDQAGARTDGGFKKISLSLARVSLLPNQFMLSVSGRLQRSLNGKNLHGSEKLAVSGAGGVIAYPAHELTGTHAAVARVELSRPLPMMMGKLNSKWQVFYDWGQAKAAQSFSDAERSRTISDFGVGLSADYRDLRVRLQVAHRLQAAAPVSEPSARTRVLAQVGWVF